MCRLNIGSLQSHLVGSVYCVTPAGRVCNTSGHSPHSRLHSKSLQVCTTCHATCLLQEGDEARRNADVSEIMRRTDFSACGDGPGTMATPATTLTSE